MIISFLVFVFALFLVLGAYLLATHGTDKKRVRLQKRLNEALMHSAQSEDIDVVLARNELMSEIPWVNRSLINLQAALQLKRMLAGRLSADSVPAADDPRGHRYCLDSAGSRVVETKAEVQPVSRTPSGRTRLD